MLHNSHKKEHYVAQLIVDTIEIINTAEYQVQPLPWQQSRRHMFHCKCMKMNILFFMRILPSYGCWGNGWISWLPVSTVTSLILYCVIG